jgi:hypothetical protein
MILDTRNKNVYGLWVSISTVFEIFGNFLLKGAGSLRMVMTYIPSDAVGHKKQEYVWFRGGDFNVFLILGRSLFKGGGSYHQMLLTKKQEYIWFK